MSVETGGLTAKVEETLTAAPADHGGMSSAAAAQPVQPVGDGTGHHHHDPVDHPDVRSAGHLAAPVGRWRSTTGWWTALHQPGVHPEQLHEVLNGGAVIPGGIAPYFVNSFVISIPAAIIPLVLACMAAYALAWVPFRLEQLVFLLIFALQVVPLQMALLPLLKLFNKGWGLGDVTLIPPTSTSRAEQSVFVGTYVPLWIAHTMFALPLAIFLHPQLHLAAAEGPLRGGPRRRREPLPDLHQDRAAALGPGDRVVRDLPVPVGVERPARRPRRSPAARSTSRRSRSICRTSRAPTAPSCT